MLSIGGAGLVRMGKWLADRMNDYQDLMARMHRMIATVLKTEKGEREARRKTLAIADGYDAKTSMNKQTWRTRTVETHALNTGG